MIDKIRAAISQYSMIREGAAVTVALSGGADSVALLFALRELGYGVSAAHVNHNLRGAESDRDEAFVREWCANLGVALTARSVDVRAIQEKHQSLEEAARKARYTFFGEIDGLIATAHTASDNAETVLLNLIRGTGLKGLCGIPPVRERIIRPLILAERSEVLQYCRERGLQYVTDSSNACEDFTRNRLRLTLIPLIKEINPAFDGSMTAMCEILRNDCDFLESLADCGDCSVNHLQSVEKPLLTRIIIQLLAQNNISPSKLRVGQIIEIVRAGQGKVNLAKHKFAVIEDKMLKITTIIQNYR
jgi:tRNA(Ile)-lysidine synthase